MGVRIARQAQAIRLAAAVVCAALALSPASRAAAQAADEPAQPAPALSASCNVPAADIATAVPLPRLQEEIEKRRRIRVLAIGSSSTVGLGASSPNLNYPSQLESILEKTFKGLDVVIINRGVSGEVASATADRLKTLVGLEKPNLVLWQVGTNDALLRVPVAEFAETVRDAVRWLKDHGVDTVLVGLQYALKVSQDEHYRAIRTALRDIATGENVLLVRRYEAMEFIEKAKAGPLMSPDELHLNDLGYRCMAEHVARALVVSAFLHPGPKPQPRTKM